MITFKLNNKIIELDVPKQKKDYLVGDAIKVGGRWYEVKTRLHDDMDMVIGLDDITAYFSKI